jgi:hypothetical protein
MTTRQATYLASGKLTPELIEEMYAVLFRVVRTNLEGFPMGHDLMMDARSIVRRTTPDAYADLVARRTRAGLPLPPEAADHAK